MTFPILRPQYAKSSIDSPTKIPKNIKTVSKNECYWYVLLYFKFCFQQEFSPLLVCGGNAAFHCLDGKRFAEKSDRYITTIVFIA